MYKSSTQFPRKITLFILLFICPVLLRNPRRHVTILKQRHQALVSRLLFVYLFACFKSPIPNIFLFPHSMSVMVAAVEYTQVKPYTQTNNTTHTCQIIIAKQLFEI